MTTGSENIEWCVQQQPHQQQSGRSSSGPQLLYKFEILPNGNRRAIANQPIKAGQVILKNAPLAMVPHDLSQHCLHCFQPPSKRCSACQQVWYCSRNCQMDDFKYHRIECQPPSSMDTLHHDARLLIRTMIQLQQQQQQQQQQQEKDQKCRFVHGMHVCSHHHFYQLQPTTTPLDAYDQEILQQALRCFQEISIKKPQVLAKLGLTRMIGNTILLDSLEPILRRFRCNNFGIVNSLCRVIATGIYPLAALLNHSCAPNCLLRYTNQPSTLQSGGGASGGGTRVVEIVAAKDIASEEELTHSYVELVAPTVQRQEQVQQIYGFPCPCSHCQSPSQVSLPAHYSDWKCRELVQWILEFYNPTTKDNNIKRTNTATVTASTTPTIQVSLDDLLQPPMKRTSTGLLQQIQTLQQKANMAMTNDNVTQEQECLSQAIQFLLEHNNGHDHPHTWWFSMELYQLLCQRLSTWIVLQQPSMAIQDCEHVVAVLCLALAHIPNHPLLGLQLFTLGDLYAAAADSDKSLQERATQIYQWALHTLSISHGPESEMVQLLHEKVAILGKE